MITINKGSLGNVYPTALAELQKVFDLYPDSENLGKARYYIGRCFHQQGNLQQARVEYQTVLDLYPGASKANDARYYLGESHFDEGFSIAGFGSSDGWRFMGWHGFCFVFLGFNGCEW